MTFLDDPKYAGQGVNSPEPVAAALSTAFKPTAEQEAIIRFATEERGNMMIEALAGAAKTSTLVLVANHPTMQNIPTLALAFNKKIAEEMKARLPGNCVSSTLNSLGHRAWGAAIGRKLHLDTKKSGEIMKSLIQKKPKGRQDFFWDQYADLLKLVSLAKSSGYVPDRVHETHVSLLSDEEFFSGLDEELDEECEQLVKETLEISIAQSLQGTVDFDDQIYMSTLFPCRFQPYRLTMIDEAQDLSALNHFMLKKIVGSCRLFAVGDPYQAIYGFRGAYSDSMSRLRESFGMTVLQLSTSFRCPRAVVKEAQWRAPHMNAPDWAAEGEVKTLPSWGIDQLTADAVIVCRNNAPIFKMAILLLSEGRYPQIVGNDIGKTLLKTLSKIGPAEMPQAEALQKWEIFRMNKLSKAREHAKASTEDFCRCLRIFIERGDTLGAAVQYADHLMNQTGPIKMMTGHKSKGLEFDNVYILDKKLLRLEFESGKNQDKNLLYVMQTRAKKTLTYVETETFVPMNIETIEEAKS
jgi:DNA helicase-2/ATP-dependent DNA helicase PcrA